MWAREPRDANCHRGGPCESLRWIEGYERVAERAQDIPQTRFMYVADREAYIVALMARARDLGTHQFAANVALDRKDTRGVVELLGHILADASKRAAAGAMGVEFARGAIGGLKRVWQTWVAAGNHLFPRSRPRTPLMRQQIPYCTVRRRRQSRKHVRQYPNGASPVSFAYSISKFMITAERYAGVHLRPPQTRT